MTDERPPASRLGLALFGLYAVMFVAFVAVAAFGTFEGGKPRGGLASESVLGLPWGVVAGFGLIASAFALALLYALLARDRGESGR